MNLEETGKNPGVHLGQPLSRRSFLTLAAAGAGALLLPKTLLADTTSIPSSNPTIDRSFQPQAPYYGTFFYPWYHTPPTDKDYRHWVDNRHTPPDNFFSMRYPERGLYSSNDPSVIYDQLTQLKTAKQTVAISSWWGKGSEEDKTFNLIINDIMNRPDNPYPNLRWAIYHEPYDGGKPEDNLYNIGEIAGHLDYIQERYANQPGYLKIGGKPVIFVYSKFDKDGLEFARRWHEANLGRNFYVNLKVFPGFEQSPNQPDSWHQYAPAERFIQSLPLFSSVSAGFYKDGEKNPRLLRDPAQFEAAVRQMVNSAATWKLTCWNEYGEGTAVEPSLPVIQQAQSGKAIIDQSPQAQASADAEIRILNKYLPSVI